MAKQHKIKHYNFGKTTGKMRARPHPLSVLLTLLVICGLVFVGISIYDPVYRFIMGEGRPDPVVDLPEPEPAGGEDAPAEEEPAPPAFQATDLRMAFLPGDTARDTAALNAFLDDLDTGAVDTVLVDIKDKQGYLQFQTGNAEAAGWGVVSPTAIDLRALTAALEGRGFGLAVRMPAFQDAAASGGNREYAIRYQNTESRWLDAAADMGGKSWLNPYSAGARAYLTALAVEAAEAGAVFVLLEDVQFPDGSSSANATYGPEVGSISRQQALKTFVEEITEAVEAAGAGLGVYLPAIHTTQDELAQVRYGGAPVEIAGNTLVLGLLPYQFTQNFSAGGLEIAEPLLDPVATAGQALRYVQARAGDIRIIPLLQGGSESASSLTAQQVQAEIELAKETGCAGYILYHPAGNYAFA